MPRKRAVPPKRDRVREFAELQSHVVGRAADYAQRLAELAGQGSVEPRPYVEALFGYWSGLLDDVADWWRPAPLAANRDPLPVARFRYQMRAERGDFRFEVPAEVFDCRGGDVEISLSTDGLVRTFDAKNPLRPMVALAPEQNVRIHPPMVTRAKRRTPSYKVFGVTDIVQPHDVYRGVVWGATKAEPQRFPVATMELEIV